MTIILQSPAFKQNHLIPRKYTGDGADVSPELSWSGIPPAARELALIVDDPDAPTPEPWVHWVLYKIPPNTPDLAEHVVPALRVPQPAGALQGQNSWPKGIGYRGPAPPKGHGLHHYHFRLYALDTPLDLKPGAEKQELLAAMKGHILAQGELVGTYQR
ncbi:MAG: YbhB/YbcL family Raf kinase inhibitor-like protein [Deltaproteobacteria bacterium]